MRTIPSTVIRFLSIVAILIFTMPDVNIVTAQSTYNTAFITNAQFGDYQSMNADSIRYFLSRQGSYLRNTITDTNGVNFDPATTIANMAVKYKVNPRIILATIQKESSAIALATKPNLGWLAGCSGSSTAQSQIECAAKTFRAQYDLIASKGTTSNGWGVGITKKTQDGVSVTPATKAVAIQFSYTPYAGYNWGGKIMPVKECPPYGKCGGVYLFYKAWNDFKFGMASGGIDLNNYCKHKGYIGVDLVGPTVNDWKCKSSSGNLIGINLYDTCKWQYLGLLNIPKYPNDGFYTPDSWKCYIR